MNDQTKRAIGLGVLVIVAMAGLFWWMMGAAPEAPVATAEPDLQNVARRAPPRPPPEPTPVKVKTTSAELPEEGVAEITETCAYIVEWEQRNVPQWVILSNMNARAQRFLDADLACLTAAGVTPAILDYAERNYVGPDRAERIQAAQGR